MLKIDLQKYKTLIFDCDGVVLNSNKLKTEAFYEVTKAYGQEPALILKKYHMENGGISRYAKFEYFLTEILEKELDKLELDQLLDGFALVVKKSLLNCEVAEGLPELIRSVKGIKTLIASGGDQGELREVFGERGLDKYFNSGIFGSPDTKLQIIKRELSNNNITHPVLFLGDAKYDYEAASEFGFDFVFLTAWSEFEEWSEYFHDKNIGVYRDMTSLLEGECLPG